MILRKLVLSTVGDITIVMNGVRHWNDDLRKLSTILDEVMRADCTQGEIKLRPIQCWLVQGEENAFGVEILGLIDQIVVIRKWALLLRRCRKGSKTKLELANTRHAKAEKFQGK